MFTGNYGEAGALEWYGVSAPVYSGHNGWGDWGHPPDGGGVWVCSRPLRPWSQMWAELTHLHA